MERLWFPVRIAGAWLGREGEETVLQIWRMSALMHVHVYVSPNLPWPFLLCRMDGPIWTRRLLEERAGREEALEAFRAVEMVKNARERANISKKACDFIMKVGGVSANMS